MSNADSYKALDGLAAVITGAGGGLGRAIALGYAAAGARVAASDVAAARAEEIASCIRQRGGAAFACAADVTQPAEVEALMARAQREFGAVDVLVNVAGVGLTRSFLKTTLEEWERVIQVNLTGAFLCSQAAARLMAARGRGAIINISSLSAQRGGSGRAAYGASKAGVTMLTRVMAVELSPLGITVNEIAPGPVDTEMTAITHDAATREAYHRLIPMRRYATPEEIAEAAVFLASPAARFVNGHTLNVDGGFQAAGLIFPLED